VEIIRVSRKDFKDYIGYDVSTIRSKCLNPVKVLMEISMETFSSMNIDLEFLETTYVP
jgi:hypothetical protein